MFRHSRLVAVGVALLATTCARHNPVAPAGTESTFQTLEQPPNLTARIRPQIRVGDVGGSGDIAVLLETFDLGGGGFSIEGANGDLIAGGDVPASAVSPALLAQPRN